DQIAQDVTTFNASRLLAGDFYLRLTGRPEIGLNQLETAALEEIQRLADAPTTADELERVVNGIRTGSASSLEQALAKADQMNSYYYYTGNPDFAAQDLARYQALTPADVQEAARKYLAGRPRIVVN